MNVHRKIVKKVIDYIEDNLENEIDLEKIAENIGYSRFHLNRIFTEETGYTIYKYLQMRRLTTAAQKLVDTEKPITQIAYEAGYHSQQAFSLAFKQIYLYPPKTYRDIGIFVPRQNKISMKFHTYSDYGKYKVCIRKIEGTAA
ncbi:MAG: helix-turn-helix transcriptional regulator [Blautia sp.]